jgi:hypothetical protein
MDRACEMMIGTDYITVESTKPKAEDKKEEAVKP